MILTAVLFLLLKRLCLVCDQPTAQPFGHCLNEMFSQVLFNLFWFRSGPWPCAYHCCILVPTIGVHFLCLTKPYQTEMFYTADLYRAENNWDMVTCTIIDIWHNYGHIIMAILWTYGNVISIKVKVSVVSREFTRLNDEHQLVCRKTVRL